MTLDGTPLSEGTVRFVPAGETPGPKVSVVVTEGKFELEEANGPIVGSHRIEIESTDHGGFALDDETAFERLKVSGQKMIKVVRVPWIYNQRSILTADVTSDGPNEFTFALRTSQQSSVRRMPSGRR
ncbi:hypothetical protein GC176_09605 [bacterium]|nr:hypothetical protein [bacterium]